VVDYIETMICREIAEIEEKEDSQARDFELALILELTQLYRDGIIEACVGENGKLLWSIADLPFTTIQGEQN
jgi:hypothetical protein